MHDTITVNVTPEALWAAVNTGTGFTPYIPVLERKAGWRDATIALALDADLDVGDFTMLAEHAHDPYSRSLLTRIMNDSFHGADTASGVVPDRIRRIARQLAETGSAHRAANPMAAAAYLDWTVGDFEEASGMALRALDVNPRHTLASIVMAAISHGIAPGTLTRN